MTINDAVEIAKANKLCFSDHHNSQISPDSLLKLYRGHNILPNYIHFVSCESEVNAAMVGAEKNMKSSDMDFAEAVRLSQEFGLPCPDRLFFKRDVVIDHLSTLLDGSNHDLRNYSQGYRGAISDMAQLLKIPFGVLVKCE